MVKGIVNKIIPFSSVDGPGNRLAIFLQGCNFDCLNCHNPETINHCLNCGICTPSCPTPALEIKDQKVIWKPTDCVACDLCVKKCPYNSTPKTTALSVDEMLTQIAPVKGFLSGVTVSGGECTLQKDFLIELGAAVKNLGLTFFIDTNGSTDFELNPKLTDAFDMAMLDVKSIDADEHFKLVKHTHETVLKNLKYLAKIGKLYEVRTVIIPNVLDNERNVREISQLIAEFAPSVRYKLIKYRPLGVRKNLIDSHTPSEETMQHLKSIAIANGCEQVITI